MREKYYTTQKKPIKLFWGNKESWRMPSGAVVVPTGRFSTQCQAGLHKWFTEKVFTVPFMVCSRCGYRLPRPVLEGTSSKREMVETVQEEMDKKQPTLWDRSDDLKTKEKLIDLRRKRMEKLVVRLHEERQQDKRDKPVKEDKGW